MTTMSKDDVKATLTPFHAMIRQVVEKGFDECVRTEEFRLKSGYAPMLYSRTVANNVFDAIARNAKSVFGREKTVRIRDEAQTVKFIFSNAVIVRFKKGDNDHLSQNIPTQAVMDYLDPQQTLPGFPSEAAKVEIMWKANDIGTEIEEITVAARNGKTLLWSYIIGDEEESSGSGDILPFPTGPAPDEFNPLVVVKPRKIKGESEK